MPDQIHDYHLCVFGAGAVGKSSLILRFVRGTFKEPYTPTIEDTYRQVISCNKQVCTLLITDTTGSYQFPAMRRLSVTKGQAFILVYSVTDRSSFEHLEGIYAEMLTVKGKETLSKLPIILIGNKTDEADSRQVAQSEGKALAKRWSCGFMETSAKQSWNVKESFQQLLQMEQTASLALVSDKRKRFSIYKHKKCCFL